ncbi:DUF6438 domain-containing protein [Sphingomonas sp. NPDC079357]|uniref:DUF6438 domain-containing protein n=1 Tax=Sphingomonas sp. NPDC079357 TaxID=3364518 RepID=UPI00384EBDE1
MRGLMALGLVLAAGCTPVELRSLPAAGAAVAIEGDSISYATGPCYGTCPVYTVTVRPDGTGTFEGERFTAVTGRRAFRVTADDYRHFAAALAPYRPDGERRIEMGTSDCGPAPTDMPSIDVNWVMASGGAGHLHFYTGCRVANAAMAKALQDAPTLLPIAGLIGKR